MGDREAAIDVWKKWFKPDIFFYNYNELKNAADALARLGVLEFIVEPEDSEGIAMVKKIAEMLEEFSE